MFQGISGALKEKKDVSCIPRTRVPMDLESYLHEDLYTHHPLHLDDRSVKLPWDILIFYGLDPATSVHLRTLWATWARLRGVFCRTLAKSNVSRYLLLFM